MTRHAYEAIADALREEIDDGVWPAGTTLPTIPRLMERFGVSRITVRGAIDQLSDENRVRTGYVDGRRGVIVRSRVRTPIWATDGIRNDRPKDGTGDVFVEMSERAGHSPSKRFTMKIAAPPLSISRRLGTDPDELVVTRTVYQLIDGEPWSSETTFFPRQFAEECEVDTPNDIPEGTTRRIAEKGYRETSWLDEVLDENAGPDDAEHLSVPVGHGLQVRLRTGASGDRITRVTRYVYMVGRTQLLWELGDWSGDAGDVLRASAQRVMKA